MRGGEGDIRSHQWLLSPAGAASLALALAIKPAVPATAPTPKGAYRE